MCGNFMCRTCAFEVDVCKCCEHHVKESDAGMICGDCIIEDWFSHSKSMGFRCVSCKAVCNAENCNVINILKGQTTCPICFEPFDVTYHLPKLQACELHKVCTACTYDERRGCPICRVGRWDTFG